MRPSVIVTDLDRTLTTEDLALDARIIPRILELRRAGVRTIVATGRELAYVRAIGLDRAADAIVGENGALGSVDGKTTLFADDAFPLLAREALGEEGAAFSWSTIIGSGPRHLAARASGRLLAKNVDHQAVFNADEVMLLPPGVDKASGVAHVLRLWEIGWDETWAIGDGENDVPLFQMARMSAAPANAHPIAASAAGLRCAQAHADAFLAWTLPLVASEPSPLPPHARVSSRAPPS